MLVRTKRREYSQYDLDAFMVNVKVTAATPGTYDFVLVRDDGYGDIATRRIAIGASADVAIPLTDFSLDNPADVSPTKDGINYVRQGMYHVEVRSTAGVLQARTASFPVSVLTVESFKLSHLLGIPLYVDAVLTLVKAPAWASCEYIDPGMLKGAGVLAYNATANTVAFRSGAPVEVVPGEPLQLYPLDQSDAYIEIVIDEAPAADASVTVTVDTLRLRDDDLRRYIWRAYGVVQQQIGARLEATIFTSDPATFNGHYDEVIDALPFERGQNRTIHVRRSAAQPLRKVTSLRGYYAGQKSLEVPLEWLTVQEKAATITMLPISGAAVMTTTAWGMWGLSPGLMGAQVSDFWHVDGVSGLKTLDKDGRSIREAIARVAAIDALADLSLAVTTGRTNFSAQREGVSESWNYGSQGAYGEKIAIYKEWLDKNLPKLKSYFGGIKATVFT